MKKICALVYVREYFKPIYLPMFSAMPGVEIQYVTDFPTESMFNLRERFYKALSRVDTMDPVALDLDDVIHRCRLLRNIDRKLASSMALAMHDVVEDLLDSKQFNVVVGQMVDDYITHLFSLGAEKRGIRYVGLCGSYFNGYSQITQYSDGSGPERREVSTDEAKRVLDIVSTRTFRMDYGQPTAYSYPRHVVRVSKYLAKRAAFGVVRHWRKDPLNYHCMVQPHLGQPKKLLEYPRESAFDVTWRSKADAATKPIVYMPLAFFPEASTDYWVPNLRFLKYEDAICEIASQLGRTHFVMVKEHHHMLGIRSPSFYNRLRELEGVVSVPPGVNSNMLLSDYRPRVLVGGGSVGLEATLRGLPVLSFCPSSYWFKSSGASFVRADNDVQTEQILLSTKPADVDSLEFIRRCLASNVPFDFMHAASLPAAALSSLRTFLEA